PRVGLPSVVLRPSGIYGPHGRYGLATVIASLALAKAKEGKGQRSVRGGARMTHVHVEDVAEAAAHLVTAEGVIGRAFNVADGHAVAWGELMAALERELGLDETRPIVLTPAKARWLGRAAALMSRRTRRANARLEAAWRRLCAERGLVPALCPRIDASAYDYASADPVYACDALEATGWRARHRDVLAGLRDTFARYPLVVDPLVATEEAVLTAPDGAPHDYFGSSVALSADGSVALVGAFWDATSVAATGSARVFVRTETGWVEEATLVAPDGAVGDEFGWSVALSADGKVALVGAPGDDMAAGTNVGSAHVFVRTESGDWVHEAMLVAPDGAAADDFGFSVALSADGKVALVGAYADDVAADRNVGSARVFVRTDSGDWVEEAMLVARDGAEGGDFGFSVALSADGKVALVGAYADDTPASEEAGSARVFVRTETGDWVEEAMLAAPDGAADDWFGRSVALSADGRVALVGAERDDTPAGEDAGSARVFVRTERETGSRRRCWSRPTVRRGASSAVRSRGARTGGWRWSAHPRTTRR
ncbi:MAG TPA: NAD-dependent epimerase/dehydratase family protein, partial [Sandaracinaceae bacterium]